MTKYITIYVPIVHGEYPMEKTMPKSYSGTVVDEYQLANIVGDIRSKEIIAEIVNELPDKAKNIIESHYGYYNNFTLDCYCGTLETFKAELDACVNALIPRVYESGADNDHYDYIPSAVEEFIILCRQVGYLDPVQKLYDSLWQGPPRSAYYPLDEGGQDPGLYGVFENIGIELHKDHPIEQWTLDYLENLAQNTPVLFETIASVACRIALKRGDFSETANYYEAARKYNPRIKALFDLSMEKTGEA